MDARWSNRTLTDEIGDITFEVIRNSDNKKFTVYDIVRTQYYTCFMIYDGEWKYIDADLFRECDKN